VGTCLRLYHLDRLPPGLSFDEAINGVNALSILHGAHPAFFDHFNREALYMYMIAASTALLGHSALALRLPAALTSALTVPVMYVSVRQVFLTSLGPRRSALLAAFSSLFLAISFRAISIGRMAYRENLLPPIVLVALLVMWEASSRRSEKWAALGGLVCGLGWYAYLAGRALPLFGFAALILAELSHREGGRAISLRPLMAYTAATTLTILPMAIHFGFNPSRLLARMSQAAIRGPLVPKLLSNIVAHVGAWFWKGESFWRHGLPGKPCFDPLVAVLAAAGLLMFLWRARRSYSPYAHVLLVLAVMAIPSVFSDGPLESARPFGMLAPALIVPAYCLEVSYEYARGRWARGSVAAWLPRLAVAAVFVFSGVRTYRDYFQVWAEQIKTVMAFDEVFADTALALNGQAEAGRPVIVPVHSEVALSNEVLQYLYTGPAPLVLVNVNANRAFGRVSELCRTYGRLQLVDWQWEALQWAQATHGDPQWALKQALRMVAGYETGQVTMPSGVLRSYACPKNQVDQQPISVLSSPVVFGAGAVTLKRAEAGTCQPLPGDQSPNACIWLTLEWQGGSIPLPNPLAVSVRLNDPSGTQVSQVDTWLVDDWRRDATRWESGASLWSYHVIEWDAGQSLPGSYCPKVIVYDPGTLAAIGHDGQSWTGNAAELGLECIPVMAGSDAK
jgi:4-amino-4-deoxy-L-arabinose transferase-like glycosyltransferase